MRLCCRCQPMLYSRCGAASRTMICSAGVNCSCSCATMASPPTVKYNMKGGGQCSVVLVQCSAAPTCPSKRKRWPTYAPRITTTPACPANCRGVNNLKGGEQCSAVLVQCSAAPTCQAAVGCQMHSASRMTPACSRKLRGGHQTILRRGGEQHSAVLVSAALRPPAPASAGRQMPPAKQPSAVRCIVHHE